MVQSFFAILVSLNQLIRIEGITIPTSPWISNPQTDQTDDLRGYLGKINSG
jgi:hypothetical protein